MKGYKAAELKREEESRSQRSLWTQCQAVADMKFSYVVSCQQYSIQKRSGDARAKDILKLMVRLAFQLISFGLFYRILLFALPFYPFGRYPSLRVAYIDEVEDTSGSSKTNQKKIYYSALVRAAPPTKSMDSSESQPLDQVPWSLQMVHCNTQKLSTLIGYCCAGYLSNQASRTCNTGRGETRKSKPCHYFHTRRRLADNRYEPGTK